MDWNDLQDDGKDIDYWKILDDSDKDYILNIVKNVIYKDDDKSELQKWTKKNQKKLMKSYIEGLKELRLEAFYMSFQDFGIFSYVAVNYKKGDLKRQKVELKPQSKELQKELEKIYTKNNIDKAIKDLGVFTKDDKGDV